MNQKYTALILELTAPTFCVFDIPIPSYYFSMIKYGFPYLVGEPDPWLQSCIPLETEQSKLKGAAIINL